MTSLERVRAAIHHQTPDRVPLDSGSTPVTGIHVSTYSRLREALGFPQTRVKVGEPFQMLADLEPEVTGRIRIFGAGGGFAFNTLHNIQARTPPKSGCTV